MRTFSKDLLAHEEEGKYILVLDTPSKDFFGEYSCGQKYIDVLLQPDGSHTYMPTSERVYWDTGCVGTEYYGCKRVNFIREVELRNKK